MLCAKLAFYGFDHVSRSIVQSYLLNRFQALTINDGISNIGKITSGVPRGSILGPLLFLIYTAELLNAPRNCKIHGFADDTQLYQHFDHLNVNTACQLINEDLDIIASQSEQMGIKLNVKKCSAICLSTRK